MAFPLTEKWKASFAKMRVTICGYASVYAVALFAPFCSPAPTLRVQW